MAKQVALVNGIEFNVVEELPEDKLKLSSTKHTDTFTTSFDELNAHFGVKTAYSVKLLLNRR